VKKRLERIDDDEEKEEIEEDKIGKMEDIYNKL